MIGITGYGAYLPRLRMSRQAICTANSWYAPSLKGKGTRSLANWDEDAITMAVAAARDCLGPESDRTSISALFLASTTLPFAERLNAGIVAGALTLDDTVEAFDISGSQRAGLSALGQALKSAAATKGVVLLAASDSRTARAASAAELNFGDGAAAVTLGSDGVLATHLSSSALSIDFVDRFRLSGARFDYNWEERWVRDEGVSKLMLKVINDALKKADLTADAVDHFVMPSSFRGIDAQIAKATGIRADAVAPNLFDSVGECGTAHALIELAAILEQAAPGSTILVAQFGSGAEAHIFRATDAISKFKPTRGVNGWLAQGVEETSYTKFLSFKNLIDLERGMRGEQDQKTALSTAYRHREALSGLVAGRCEVTGEVSFPPSRIIYADGQPLHDTQRPYKLADLTARILSWSAEYLSFNRAPPHCYGQVDFDGGGRILMEFTDVNANELASGMAVEMTFRIKAFDEARGFRRYFWKATPVRHAAINEER